MENLTTLPLSSSPLKSFVTVDDSDLPFASSLWPEEESINSITRKFNIKTLELIQGPTSIVFSSGT